MKRLPTGVWLLILAGHTHIISAIQHNNSILATRLGIMQQDCLRVSNVFADWVSKFGSSLKLGCVLFAGLLISISACREPVSLPDPVQKKPYEGISLRIFYSAEVPYPQQVEEFAHIWSLQTGAKVEVRSFDPSSHTRTADIYLVSFAQMPILAEAGQISTLPDSVRVSDSIYEWSNILGLYSSRLSQWGAYGTYALPLFAEGWVLAYRSDVIEKAGVLPAKEWTWDEGKGLGDNPHGISLAEVAAKIQAIKPGPVFPRLPTKLRDLDAEFYSIASCFDRRVMTQSEEGGKAGKEELANELASFQYEMMAKGANGKFVDSYRPRIAEPAFIEALKVLRKMQPYRVQGQSDRPSDDFRKGDASICLAHLDDLARFQQPDCPIRGKVGIAPLPGSTYTFGFFNGKRVPNPASRLINRVPYQGWGGTCGTISNTAEHPDAALAFLTALGNPERNGQEAIIAARWGDGPYRSTQIEEGKRFLWLGYDLSPIGTKDLTSVLRDNIDPAILNPTIRLRIPNQEKHIEVLTRGLIHGLLKDPKIGEEQLLQSVAKDWESLWLEPAQKRTWLRLNAGWDR